MTTRHTIQRDIIEAEVHNLANHPTADEVFDAVHVQHPNISKATVYRTLSKLADSGDIARVKINNGADRFDHQTFAHYHVRCTQCGRVDDVIIPIVDDKLDQSAQKVSGYEITGCTLQFDGICPSCREALKTSA